MRNDDVLVEVGVSELGSCTSPPTQSTRGSKRWQIAQRRSIVIGCKPIGDRAAIRKV
jgi:hypothetical protein